MSNEDSSRALKAISGKWVCATAVATALLLLAGCEYMGPAGGKKLPLPKALVIQSDKSQTEPPPSDITEPRGATREEVYPATGTLFGSPDKGGNGSAKRSVPPREGKYTLNFEDAELSEVAKVILGDTLKVNYVISPKVTGKVSLQTTRALTEDEMIPTLEMLLKTNGAVLIKDRSLYRIEPEATGTVNAPSVGVGRFGQSIPPGFQLRVVPLRYVGAAEMQKVIEPLMPPKSVIRVDENRNLLLLAASADELQSVMETISIFDVDFMRGMSVGLFPLKNVEAGTVAEELDKLLTVSGKGPMAGMFRLMPIERLQSILVVSPQPRYLDEVQTWIERLDRYNPTKTSNMHVYRVQNVDALELANTLSQIFGQGGRGNRTPGASLAPGMSGSTIGGGGGSSSGYGGSSSSGLGGSSSSGFGGSSSSGMGGGSSSSGIGGSSSGLGGSSSSGMGGSSSSGFGGSSSSSGFGGGGSGSGFGSGGSSGSGSFGSGSGGSFGGGGSSGGSGNQRSRSSQVADLGNNMRIVADPINNALIIMAKPQDFRDIEAVIKQLDIMPMQVLIDATIIEVALTDELKYGLKWYFTHSEGGTDGAALLSDTAAAALAATGGFSYFLTSGSGFKLKLDMLASKGKANVLSSPSLMVLNNQEASIVVGNQVPILSSVAAVPSVGTAAGVLGTQSIQYRPTGVQLKVRPRVNAGGLVSMEIEQAVDNIDQAATDQSKIASPTIRQRKVTSQVAIKSSETVILGGLINEAASTNVTGIPVLSELPWIGPLFSSTSKKMERTELVVLITPRVVENSTSSQQITNEYRRRLSNLYDPSPTNSPYIMEQGTGFNSPKITPPSN
jgi:general secretion pathway protein D